MAPCGKPKDRAPAKFKLDMLFLKRFFLCWKVMFPGWLASSTLLFILLLGVSLAVTFQGKVAVKYVSRLLYIRWRALLTSRLHSSYFKNLAYYKLNVLQSKIDNVDQRITQDVERFCSNLRKSVIVFIISPFTIAYYTYQCYNSSGYLGPLLIYGYFFTGTIINKLIMTPVVTLVFKQESLEGDFRFKHMHIRSNAESIAFYNSGRVEERKTNSRLRDLLQTQLRLVTFESILFFSINIFDYLGSILSYFIIAIAIFAGMYDDLSSAELSAQISRNSFFAMYLINCCTQLLDLSNDISIVAGVVHRIGQLLEYFAENDSVREQDNTGSELLRVSFVGSGKSSLFRILSGIWKPLSGKVERFLPFNPKAVFFMPQKTFVTDGTLRQQITYPFEDDILRDDNESAGGEEERLLELLDMVGLRSLYERVGGFDNPVDGNWEDMLSPGEMQRLSFARLFFHRPLVALLDEATSALDVASETKLYSKCKQLDITVVSVGHRDSLWKLHDYNLKLDGEGGWEFKKIENKD
ncbi:PREDICTED: ATP-binding cassette sub-family D member 4-like [Acropora digitifera]|uniref:ATP-binding cassette sub-family D member 4-like n=1 Tax=Acropora digitifera TaxID=70779 RepID=UPI00077A3621|nr:PREDICTED: ATP-binding cassette sub-family D member 4-like [Acropora digitifera]